MESKYLYKLVNKIRLIGMLNKKERKIIRIIVHIKWKINGEKWGVNFLGIVLDRMCLIFAVKSLRNKLLWKNMIRKIKWNKVLWLEVWNKFNNHCILKFRKI